MATNNRRRCAGSNALTADQASHDAWHITCDACGRVFIEGHQLAGNRVPVHFVITRVQAQRCFNPVCPMTHPHTAYSRAWDDEGKY